MGGWACPAPGELQRARVSSLGGSWLGCEGRASASSLRGVEAMEEEEDVVVTH